MKATNPEAFIWQDEDREEAKWVATSRSWLDRKACRWLGVCGGTHVHYASETTKFGHRRLMQHASKTLVDHQPDWDWQHAWTEGNDRPEDWTDDERVLRDIPDYVMEHAPLVHLYSGEQFWPCDIAEHLFHVTPTLNYTRLQSGEQHLDLHNLDELNQWQNGRWVFLTSNDDVEERPEWLEGEKNIPSTPSNPNDAFEDNDGWVHKPGRTYAQAIKDAMYDLKDWFAPDLKDSEDAADFRESLTGRSAADKAAHQVHLELKRSLLPDNARGRIRGGRSDAPAVLVTINKGHGIVDAFWFFFYSFNLGNVVLNVRFGNHVGDWEHTVVRFQHGKPKAVFFSEHNFGSAY
ncbi:Vacuolar protein sorting-associated protein 62, partial [Exophiala xenobiotica]